MVQFLSIIFFLGFLKFLLGFLKVPVFLVSPCITLGLSERPKFHYNCCPLASCTLQTQIRVQLQLLDFAASVLVNGAVQESKWIAVTGAERPASCDTTRRTVVCACVWGGGGTLWRSWQSARRHKPAAGNNHHHRYEHMQFIWTGDARPSTRIWRCVLERELLDISTSFSADMFEVEQL